MSSKFIDVVHILGCNSIVTDLILHFYICTTALGKSVFCFSKMFPGVAYFLWPEKEQLQPFFFPCR